MRVSERRKRPVDQPNDAAQPNLRRRMAKLIAAFRSTQASDNASILQFKQDKYPHRPRVRARGARSRRHLLDSCARSRFRAARKPKTEGTGYPSDWRISSRTDKRLSRDSTQPRLLHGT